MAEYIDREAALENVCFDCCENGGCKVKCAEYLAMKAIPAADVAPVIHARWRKEYTLGWYDGEQNYKLICPSCNYSYLDNHLGAIVPKHFNYCPNCGAKMEESEGDNG